MLLSYPIKYRKTIQEYKNFVKLNPMNCQEKWTLRVPFHVIFCNSI